MTDGRNKGKNKRNGVKRTAAINWKGRERGIEKEQMRGVKGGAAA